MPDITALKNLYFVQATDAKPPSEPVPATYDGETRITPLIGSKEYFTALRTELDRVGASSDTAQNAQDFIYITAWVLDLTGSGIKQPGSLFGSTGPLAQVSGWGKFSLDPPSEPANEGDPFIPGSYVLLDILKAKRQKGVDVRVLGWISCTVMDNTLVQRIDGLSGVLDYNLATIKSIEALRQHDLLTHRACLNVLGHSVGSVHVKIVVIGNVSETNGWAVGFTGGFDLHNSRHESIRLWHDVQVRVEGKATQTLYDFFCNMWNENASREAIEIIINGTKVLSAAPGTELIVPHTLTTTSPGTKHNVQVLHTVPQFNYVSAHIPFSRPSITFALKGTFEVRAALQKALCAATKYIYMEDQAFWSWEMMSWINKAIKTPRPELRVILLAPGQKDPDDPKFEDQAILSESINRSLLKGLSDDQIKQIRFFQRFVRVQRARGTMTSVTQLDGTSRVQTDMRLGPENEAISADQLARAKWSISTSIGEFRICGNPLISPGELVSFTVDNRPGDIVPPVGEILELLALLGVTVHSKTTLVDDHWAIIGSANCTQRSLYTDMEHAVSFMDESDQIVREYRKKLWAVALEMTSSQLDQLDDIDQALHVWEPSWGTAGSSVTRPTGLVLIPLPLSPEEELSGLKRWLHANIHDFDSRNEWGGLLP